MTLASTQRRWLVGTFGALTAGGLVGGVPLLAALALTLLTTVVTAPALPRSDSDVSTVLGWVPVGAMLTLFPLILVSTVAAILDISLWGNTWPARLSLVAIAVALVLIGIRRGGRVQIASLGAGYAWLLATPVAVLASLRLTWPFDEWTTPVWAATDWMSHAEKVVYVREWGALDYLRPALDFGNLPDIYPRGMHAAIAWLLQTGPAPASPELAWEQVITALGVFSVAMLILLVVGASLCAASAARMLGEHRWVAIAGPGLTAAALLYPTWFLIMQWSGFLTTAASAVLLFAVVVVLLSAQGTATRLALMMLLSAVAAHLWQLMAAPVLLAGVPVAWAWWRQGHRRLGAMAVVAVCVVVSVGSLAMVTLSPAGVSQVQVPGAFPAPSLLAVTVTCVLALGAAVVLWRRGFREPSVAWGVLISASAVGGVIAAQAAGGFGNETPYYAAKLLWHAMTVGFPLAVVVALVMADRLWIAPALRTPRPLLRWALIGAPLVLIAAFLGGTASLNLQNVVVGLAARPVDRPTVPLVVLRASGLDIRPTPPAAPWSLDAEGFSPLHALTDWHGAQVLRSGGHAIPPADVLLGHRAADLCAWLVRNSDAVRITGSPTGPRELLEAGCPTDVVRPAEWQVVARGSE